MATQIHATELVLARARFLAASVDTALPYTHRPRRKWYLVSGDDSKGKGAVVNPSLAHFLPRKASDIRPNMSATDLLHLEEAVRGIREVQNFQFWMFGAVSRLVKLGDGVPNKDALMAQAVSSMQQAMQTAWKGTTTVLANLLTFRRQAVLRNLPSSFNSICAPSLPVQ